MRTAASGGNHTEPPDGEQPERRAQRSPVPVDGLATNVVYVAILTVRRG